MTADVDLHEKQSGLAAKSVVLVVAIMAVNVANYGLNVLLANRLEPSLFGDASLMVTVLLLTGVLAATLQLSTSVAILRSPDEQNKQLAAMRLLTNRLGLIGGLAFAAISPSLTIVLQVESPWALFVMAAGVPLHLQLAVERGRLQGTLQLGRLALTFIAEGVARVVATLAVLALAPNITMLAVTLNVGFLGGYLLGRPRTGMWSWLKLSAPVDRARIGSIGTAVVAITLITNLDLIAAKGIFEPAVAGSFAALALGGRVVFFASWTLQQALLPLVVAEHPTIGPMARRRAFIWGNAGVCAVLVAVGWRWAGVWVGLAFGDAYAEIVPLVGPYALGTGIIAAVSAFAMVASSDGSDAPGRLLLVGSVVITAVSLFFGESVSLFVAARVVSLVVLAFVVVAGGRLRFAQRVATECRSIVRGATS